MATRHAVTPPTLALAPMLSLPLEAVTETTGILGNRGTGKTNTAKVYVEQLLDNGMQVVVIDPTDVWWGLKSSKDGKRAGYPVVICGGRKQDVPLSADNGAAFADFIVDSGASVVLSLRHLSQNAERTFVAALCNRLYELKGQHDSPSPLALVIDEASRLLPQIVRDGVAAVCVGAVQQLARQGRSSGFGIVVIDQRAATVNKEVLELVELMIVHRLTGPRNRKALKDWVDANADDDDRGADFMKVLPKLKRGEVWVWSPSFLDVFAQFSINQATTFDSSYTPKVGEVRKTPSAVARVDLDVLKTKLASSIEKAKRDDPAVLHARITELEAQIARAPQPHEIAEDSDLDYERGRRDGVNEARSESALESALEAEQAVSRGITIGEATERLKLRERLAAIGESLRLLDNALTDHISPQVEALGVKLAEAIEATTVAGDVETAKATPPIVAKSGSFLTEGIRRGEAPRARTSHAARVVAAAKPPRTRVTAVDEKSITVSTSSADLLESIQRALAFFAQCGVTSPSRAAVAAYTGYHPRTPTFAAAIRNLEAGGDISADDGAVTALRRFKLAPEDVAASKRQVQAIWLGKLSGIEHDVVKLLLDTPRFTLHRARIAGTLGYHPRTPTFARAIKRLATMGLVRAKGGEVAATSLLFPEGMTR